MKSGDDSVANNPDAVRDEEERHYYLQHSDELAPSDCEAEKRFDSWRYRDPLPSIAPALLNSADIFSYVCRTGMLYPFYPSKLSGASYVVRIKGKVVYWEQEEGEPEKKVINLENDSDSFKLKPNSIAFVTLEPVFRLPDYIALRFNLKISHVYKGLLLGTGPLVDPGFVGRLSIPLHNLTSNEYVFHCLDDMIEMEFTKLSPNDAWHTDISGQYTEAMYKRTKIPPNRDVEAYLGKALKGGNNVSIESSLPSTLSQMQQSVTDAKNEVHKLSQKASDEFKEFQKDARKQLRNTSIINIVGFLSFVVSLVTVVGFCIGQIISLSGAYDDSATVMQSQLQSYEEEIEEYKLEMERDSQTIEELKLSVEDLREQLDALIGLSGGR